MDDMVLISAEDGVRVGEMHTSHADTRLAYRMTGFIAGATMLVSTTIIPHIFELCILITLIIS